MEVEVRQVQGSTFIGRGDSNHWTTMDASAESGGADGATRPMEMLLIGLGGCTGIDMSEILKKMRVNYQEIKMEISADRRDKHPKVFTEIRLKYKVYGTDLPEDKITKAVKLTQEKFCSATHTLRNPAEVVYDYELIPPDGEK
ncbi:MAG: OsmC family protein [Candidatus Bipolaricaulota bacterium]